MPAIRWSLAALYDREGADELVFLDISASVEGRATMVEVVRQTAAEISIPFTVGGGIGHVDDMMRILRAGADKIGINTAAVQQPSLIRDGARRFGSQCIVVAVDARYHEEWGEWEVYIHGGRTPTGLRAVEWAREAEAGRRRDTADEHGCGRNEGRLRCSAHPCGVRCGGHSGYRFRRCRAY